MLLRLTITIGLLTGLASAQTLQNASQGSSQNSTINPATVPPTLRAQWCQGQSNTCGTLCSGDYETNECDPDTLSFTCTCNSNHSAPGLQFYKETMPTFICEMLFQDCIKAGENSQAAQDLCNINEKKNCGQLSPEDFKGLETVSSTSSKPESVTATTSSASSTASTGAAAPVVSAQYFGTGALAVGIVAALGLIP